MGELVTDFVGHCSVKVDSIDFFLNSHILFAICSGHNYIPRCVGVIEESGRQCLVLEYVEHEKPEVIILCEFFTLLNPKHVLMKLYFFHF